MSPRERPMLFAGPLVRKILSGEKTVTRRPIKPNTPFSPCAHGEPGDRIWCRETFSTLAHGRDFGGRVRYEADQAERTFDEMPDREDRWRPVDGWKKWPSIHMPRWASRLTLEITRVRVERVQDITEDDARAEGFTLQDAIREKVPSARDVFACVWGDIYGRESWTENRWCWVLDFRVVTP